MIDQIRSHTVGCHENLPSRADPDLLIVDQYGLLDARPYWYDDVFGPKHIIVCPRLERVIEWELDLADVPDE